jgi:hypothetical protein
MSRPGAGVVPLDEIVRQMRALTDAIRRIRVGDVYDATEEERQACLDALERLDAAYRTIERRLNPSG